MPTHHKDLPVALIPEGKTSIWADRFEAVFANGDIGSRDLRRKPRPEEVEKLLGLIGNAEKYLRGFQAELERARLILS